MLSTLVGAVTLLVAGYFVAVTGDNGIQTLPVEARPAGRLALEIARFGLDHPIEKAMALSVRVATATPDQACRPEGGQRPGYRVQVDYRTFFGLAYRHAVVCNGSIDTSRSSETSTEAAVLSS